LLRAHGTATGSTKPLFPGNAPPLEATPEGADLAIRKNQFNAPFHDAKSDLLNRRRCSTSAMNNRAEATVARCRDRLQKLRYSTIACRYACRSKSLSLTLLRTSAQSGNQTPVEEFEPLIYVKIEMQTHFVFSYLIIQAKKPDFSGSKRRNETALTR
jgi:hypothetical protein